MDHTSRFVTGYGTFEHQTIWNVLFALEQVMKNHGKPASIMTDHGSQFYANAETNQRGASDLKKKLVILA